LPLVTLGCGGCDTGELDVNLSRRSGHPVSGLVTVQNGRFVTQFGDAVVDFTGVPKDMFIEGESLQLELTEESTPVPGTNSAFVDTLLVAHQPDGKLRGAVWALQKQPTAQGAKFSSSPKDCAKGGSCGGHDTFMQVVLDDGTTLSAASGYRVTEGKAELGNGLSYMAGEPCGTERQEFHLGYLFIRP
jgi:hypothetical protein